MEQQFKNTVVAAVRMMLRPVASLLLKCGMTWKEFSDLSKSVFVEAATAEFGIKGRPTNVSRVSILTGISRKEVKRLRDLAAGAEPPLPTKTTDATRLLSGWHQDPAYLDGEGRPLDLTDSGPAPSFEALYDRYGGDIPLVTMLKELIKTGAVARNGDGRLRALSRFYQPLKMDPEMIRGVFGVSVQDLAATLENNIANSDKTPRRFQGYADSREVDPRYLDEFDAMLDERGQAFLEQVDQWLSEHRISEADTDRASVRIGVGVYAINGPH